MNFDVNMNSFPSDFHREIWWWGVGIVPTDESLTDKVKSQLSDEVLQSCYQWHEYFHLLTSDMYSNAELYLPASSRQYRDILENICLLGDIKDNSICINKEAWESFVSKTNRSKQYTEKNLTIEGCLTNLERTGLEITDNESEIVIKNSGYPLIFHAMKIFENSPNARKTPARHHFAHCEFRQLIKSHEDNYAGLLRRASSESREILKAVDEYAKELKIQRYVHFATIKYKYKNIRILDLNFYGDECPTLRINIGTCADSSCSDICDDRFYLTVFDSEEDILDTLMRNLTQCSDESHRHQQIKIRDTVYDICPSSRVRINPFSKDIKSLLKFIEARKESIDSYVE